MVTSEKHVFRPQEKYRHLALHSGSVFASTQQVHSPRSQSSVHFDTENILQIRSDKLFSSARRLLSAALLQRWPQVCCVKITCTELSTN